METNGIRAIADWLDGTTNALYGVNALIPAVERDGSDPEPDPIATFADATRDPWVARRLFDDPDIDLPALIVFAQPFTTQGEVQTSFREADIAFVVGQIVKDADSAAELRDALYRRRAIVRSLKQFNDNANAAARTRNSVTLVLCKDLQIGASVHGKEQDAWSIDAVIATYQTRDYAP